MTVDTHVHVWDPRVLAYPWLADADAGALDSPFLPADYSWADADRIVFVQADCAPGAELDEAGWVAGLAASWPQLAGIVAGADLRSPQLESHLDALDELGLVVGIRHLLQDEPIDRLGEPELRRGLEVLAARDLAFDACIRHPQLSALVDLLTGIPGLRVVLDHVGKPPLESGLESDEGQRWARALRRLAGLPGTFIKLSGLPAETGDTAAYVSHAGDFLRFAVDVFGPDRAMLGSDWPVSARLGIAESPGEWRERVQTELSLDGDGWEQVSGRTGTRFYRLDSATH